MKTEKEIRELINKIEAAGDIDGDTSFICISDKASHWVDCLAWVLEE